MRILLVGGTGTVGKTIAAALKSRHELLIAGRSAGDLRVDLTDEASVRAMYAKAGKLDAVIAATGHTHFGPLTAMTPAQFKTGLLDKVLGQVSLVLLGIPHVADGGSFTLTSGILNRDHIRQGANAAAVDSAIDGFVAAAAIEMPRGIRINAVSPGLLSDAAEAYDGFFPGHAPVSSARVGLAYVKSVEGALTGKVFCVD
ncbi:MAG: short chain dehydrogenase [Alphaproteobacteria bacterium]|nr:short chain dehydrogenase [Alphaproteobacteria bacterium]